MNRIQQLVGDCEPTVGRRSKTIESGRYVRCEDDAPHALFSPLHYERNYAYPLVVWLHGPNDDERQLKRIMPLVSMRNYVAVAPRGTVAAYGEGEDGHRGFGWSQTPDDILLAEHRVFAAIQMARQRFNISASRIFLAGFGCGGTMALRLALNHPLEIAGATSFNGAFPSRFAPLGRLTEARRLKLLLATGRDSTEYPPEQVCEHLRLFHAAGMAICLRQYPCGDDLTTSMLADMDRWVMDQIIGQPAMTADEASTHGGGA